MRWRLLVRFEFVITVSVYSGRVRNLAKGVQIFFLVVSRVCKIKFILKIANICPLTPYNFPVKGVHQTTL